jgi:hypothetical protein
MATDKPIIAMSAPVTITAGAGEGENKGPASFVTEFYTGGELRINGWDLPVVVDLAGLSEGKVLVANLDHDSTKRVGNFSVANDGKSLVANGTATAATTAKTEVVQSALDGYQWQSSLEVSPVEVETVKAGQKVEVNGQEFTGPIYVTRKGTLKGFAFVSHGADDNTSVTIAAVAAKQGELTMKPELKAWIEGDLGLDASQLSADSIAALAANFEGKNAPAPKSPTASNPFEERKIEAKRRSEIRTAADRMIEQRNSDFDEITAIEKMCDHAIEAGMTIQDFKLELYQSAIPMGRTIQAGERTRQAGINDRVLEAAICQAGRLNGHEKHFDDQTLQMAHDKFKSGIGLKQIFLLAAESNGYKGNYASDVNLEVQRAAFGMSGPQRQIHATGFSTLSIQTILSNVANKFLREGWNAVDMTPMRISAIRNVRDFKAITTVSLTGDLMFEELGSSGEIKHGQLGEVTYSNKADTYAKMLAITRQDIINDDLGALTAVPRRLGRGSALKLNDLFWTKFLGAQAANFFASGNNNFNEGVANMTLGGLEATDTMFMNQTDPDGKPLGIMPQILVVPTALKAKALALMTSEKIKGDADEPDGNVWRGRFRVESSPYLSNSSYTGNSAAAWYMLADPNELPMIEIAALNGRVEPTVETADADFNVLGVQMRGYSDVGVALQEFRAAVKADGGAS